MDLIDADAEAVRRALRYDARDGTFVWTGVQASYLAGRPAGSINRLGYVMIKIGRRSFAAHRVAWLFQYGVWPKAHIDHIDRDRSNNRISNLRLASPLENQMNSAPRRHNTHGWKGISYQPRHKAWLAQITISGRNHNLGRYKDPIDAAAAYDRRAHAEFGEFAYLNFSSGE